MQGVTPDRGRPAPPDSLICLSCSWKGSVDSPQRNLEGEHGALLGYGLGVGFPLHTLLEQRIQECFLGTRFGSGMHTQEAGMEPFAVLARKTEILWSEN